MAIIMSILLWLLLALVAAMRFSRARQFSDTERVRLVQLNDELARAEDEYESTKPLLTSLRFVMLALLGVAFYTVIITNFGILTGVFVGGLSLLVIPLVFRLTFFCRLADMLRDWAMPVLVKTVYAIAPFLFYLRERDGETTDTVLNSQTELLELVERSSGVLSKDEMERLKASLAFDAKTVEEVMTPKSVIDAISAAENLGPLTIDELYKTGHSRFPVYKKNIDHIVGTVYLHDLLDLQSEHTTAEKMMKRDVYFVHQDRSLEHALHGFLSKRHHLFIVVNDFRETVGLITIEDVIEALIGKKIVDEFDAFDDLRAVAEHNPKHNNQPEGKRDI